MARELRVLAEPDFPKTIFEEIQSNEMSADGINNMSAQAPKKIPLKKEKVCTSQKTCNRPKRFGGEFEGNLSSEKVPLKKKLYLIRLTY